MEVILGAIGLIAFLLIGGTLKNAERSAKRAVKRTIREGFSSQPPKRRATPVRQSARSTQPAPRPSTAVEKPVIPAQPVATPSPQTQRSIDNPPPFDETSAEPSLEHEEISGAAYVVDGDTITINKTQIRLFGIDAPEMNHPFGKKAKWALVALCKGMKIRAVITDTDDHGRTVAKCFLPDGRDLSAEMVKIGMAIDWPKFSGGIYRPLETEDARKKLWLADARQKGRMHVWAKFEARQKSGTGAK
ncbi:thermonuclease family protein [Vannielia litorea]|uniref:thermonuclease family protein n=1 Tax=Vannielia litorea TaxID=1217970 RepID=UPI0021BD3EAC|nr:thermonuclease family protein [Vannielia litorea]